MPPRPFRFAVQSFSAESGSAWRERARRVEELGYACLHLADHIIGPGPALERSMHPLQELAAVPAMAVAAEATSTLRVGCRVFCQDYRHPAVLAKEAATLDLFSEGRLELGLGAGWLEPEYAALGMRFDPARVRIDRLAETVALVKAHMSGKPIDQSGEHVEVHEYTGVPLPVQRPHPPIMIGGGSRRVLALAGREADIVSLNFNNRAGVLGPEGVKLSTSSETERKLGWVREGAGARMADLEIEIGAYFTFVGDGGDAAAKGMAGAFGLTEEEMRAHPHGLFGSVDSICQELERRRECFGISYITVTDDVMEAFAPVVERLAGQ
ncbi:MAG TPA: TIGR03621 family F420-dependent LLM class oxidoreductase [Myxococcales bacterium]|nr:TIGR03621 family F420-dependent LLM class oxidoreductase [Myxococcales bacterium]